MKRANVLVAAGAVLLVLGLTAVWVVGQDDSDDTAERTVPVLVATADLPADASGDDALAAGQVAVQQVGVSKALPGALSTSTSMAGMVLLTPVAEGEQVVATALRPANLRSTSFTIPEGKQAMAVTVGFTEGGAGYAAAGDRVNIYATIPPGTVDAPKAPYTKLLLTDVEVLDVSNELSPQRGSQAATAVDGTTATTAPTGRASVSQLTLLIAVDAQQAEQAVFASEVNLLWFTVLPQDQGESTTNGVEYAEGYLETGP